MAKFLDESGLAVLWDCIKSFVTTKIASKQDKITSSNKLAYSLISDTPTIPAAPGTLNTNNSTAQTASSSEALSGAIKLHKVSKTGSYNDLNNKPSTFPPSTHSHAEITDASGTAGAAASSNSMIVGAGNSSIDITDSSVGVSTNSFKWNNKTILTEDYEPEITSIENDYYEIGVGSDAYISGAGDDDSTADITVSVYDGVSVSTSNGLSFSWNENQVATEADLDGKQDKLVSGTSIKTINNTSLLGSGNIPVQAQLVSGTNIKTINGESVLGSGNIEIQGGGGMPMWETITTSTGTTRKSFNLSTYNEVMVVADILRNNAHHLYSVTLPVECLYDTAYEVKLPGGYASSSVYTAVFYSISKTSGAGVSANINGTSYISSTTWKVFGRTNFSAANFMVGTGAPAASIGNNGDLFLKV